MRAGIAAVALAGLCLAASGCDAAVDDHQAVLDTMLAEIASSARTSGSTFCVAPTTDADAVVRRMAPEEIHAGAQWFVTIPGQTNRRIAADPALSRAANTARRGEHPVRAVTAPDQTLPAPLQVTRADSTCRNFVTLSYPSIQGDVAFVEQVIACGDNCLGGDLYALRRERGRWRIHAYLQLWVT